jgi:D-serine deaminase-like pyridoxal phosphate-dependent protein
MEGILESIERPTPILNKGRVIRNIGHMAVKARRSGVRFRPHFKTHQSATIGDWFRDFGVETITVSSVDMAVYFAENGWEDITIAFPVNLRQTGVIRSLAERIKLAILVESKEVIPALVRDLMAEVDVWLKVDAGYHRTGVAWDDAEGLVELGRTVSEARGLRLRGLLTHAGHTYGAGSPAKIAGNFVFYDLMQYRFGSCDENDIAMTVACPIVALHPERGQLALYGGAVHLSNASIPGAAGRASFGAISLPAGEGWSPILAQSEVVSLSQEHGIVQASEALLDGRNVGDIVAVIPVHSCLTANLLGRYLALDGEEIEMFRYTA